MYRYIIRGMILGAMFLGVVDCGGDSSPTGKKTSKKEGRVFVKNEYSQIVDVFYVDETGTKIETAIDPGEQEEVTRGVLDGGTTIKLNVDPRRNCRSDVEVEVTVDGNRIVRVMNVGACGTKYVEYII